MAEEVPDSSGTAFVQLLHERESRHVGTFCTSICKLWGMQGPNRTECKATSAMHVPVVFFPPKELGEPGALCHQHSPRPGHPDVLSTQALTHTSRQETGCDVWQPFLCWAINAQSQVGDLKTQLSLPSALLSHHLPTLPSSWMVCHGWFSLLHRSPFIFLALSCNSSEGFLRGARHGNSANETVGLSPRKAAEKNLSKILLRWFRLMVSLGRGYRPDDPSLCH